MPPWSSSDYCVHLGGVDVSSAADVVMEKVFRTTPNQPGFVILTLEGAVDSHRLRRMMVELKEELSRRHQERWREALCYLSLGRFDQQTSTKLHLDGAPERSFLMLGYERTEVRSQLLIADFSRCAHDLGLGPAEFLQQHNPMFGPGAKLLRDYTTTITDWHEDRPRIVLINNSCGSCPDGAPMLGVLHGALIAEPQTHLQRIINSTMIAPAGCVPLNAEAQVPEFVATESISGPIAKPEL